MKRVFTSLALVLTFAGLVAACANFNKEATKIQTTVDAKVVAACATWTKDSPALVQDVVDAGQVAQFVPVSVVQSVGKIAVAKAPSIKAFGDNACANPAALTSPADETVAWLEGLNTQLLGLKASVATVQEAVAAK